MINDTDDPTSNQAAVPGNPPGATGKTMRTVAAKPKSESDVRDARLKAALKANMARRKGQARARADGGTSGGAPPAANNKNE